MERMRIVKIILDDRVTEWLQPKLQTGDRLYFDFEDGVGPFANTEISCRLDLSFRLIVTGADYPSTGLEVYNIPVETAVGIFYIKETSLPYFEEENFLTFNPQNGLRLKGKSGIVADNIAFLRMEQSQATGQKA